MNDTYENVDEIRQFQALRDGLITADRFINRTYLINLHEKNIVPLDNSLKSMSTIRLFKVEKFIYDKNENINDKLISVYSALQNINSSALMLIQGDEAKVSIYVGIRSEYGAKTAGVILQKGFEGNFPGSTLIPLKNTVIVDVFDKTIGQEKNKVKNVACVTVIPSERDKDKDKFVQGIEKFIDTMQGEKYSALIVAEPISKMDFEARKKGYEELYSALSPYKKTSLAYGENYSKAVTKGMSENFSYSVNNSISNTTGKNKGTNTGSADGTNYGFNGGAMTSGRSRNMSIGYTSGSSWSKAISQSTGESIGESMNISGSVTQGDSRNTTIEHINKTVEVLLKKIDKQAERMSSCEAFGIWECSAYFLSDDIQMAVVAANAYKALMLGEQTDVEDAFVNVWGQEQLEQTKEVLKYLNYGMHPMFVIPPENGYDEQIVTPANQISGKEIPLLMGLPHKSVSGLPVSSMAEFGRNIFIQNKSNETEKKIRIGNVYHMGKDEENTVFLNLNSFTSHCFITGSTGSGKSNTTYCLLEKMLENNIPFLVVEPAKGEYKEAFGKVESINVFTTNPLIGQMLKLNPFKFDPKIHVLEHLDRLIEIFNACWEMYAAMPAIMKDACERVYSEKGWDLLNSIYLGKGEPQYPTFKDLMRTIPKIINDSGYSSDTKGDYIGALVTRVTSLTNGISGQIFCDCYEIDDKTMFDENTIVDLSRIGSSETKSLIMGILVLKLTEYRMANSDGSNHSLRHVTVLEEAHNLLKRSKPGQTDGNLVGKSVEMICNSIAEMRTYGEGFIIVDQSPTSVDVAAIKNTNTKIIMRLPEKEDCEAIGNSVALEKEQIKEISKLNTGIAVVMQNNWLEAVLTHIDRSTSHYEIAMETIPYHDIVMLRSLVLKELIEQYRVKKQMNAEEICSLIDGLKVDKYKKKEFKCAIRYAENRLMQRDAQFFCDTLMNLAGTANLFDQLEKKFGKDDSDNAENMRKTFIDEISNYAVLPQNFERELFRWLIVSRNSQAENTSIYSEVYRALYTKGVKNGKN